MDAETVGKVAEGAGKAIGVSWLMAHHVRNLLRWWKDKRKNQKVRQTSITGAEQDEQMGRLLRGAAYQYVEFRQQIEQMERTLELRAQEIVLLTTDRDRQRDLAKEYHDAAEFWSRFAKELQSSKEKAA